MFAVDHRKLAEALLPVVLRAGAVEMSYFGAGVAVEHKADRSPVTVADREAEEMIVEALAAAAPGVPVVAEELAAAGRAPPTGDAFFLVDPLDGTREFIHARREFTINIGLVMGGRPVFGLIYAPALGSLYATLGADKAVALHGIAPSGDAAAIALDGGKILRTSPPDPRGLVVHESRSRASPNLGALFKHHKVRDRKQAASSLKFCLVAEGVSDIYAQFGETSEWDTAAGEAILVAAGGAVTTLDGAPLAYGPHGRGGTGFANPPFLAWGRKPPQPW